MLPAFYPCIDEALGVENVENVSTNVHWHIQIIINKILFLTTQEEVSSCDAYFKPGEGALSWYW